jgi:holo-[acyl-carrier protein] synthase
MEIYGIGVDIVEVKRIKNAIKKNSGFLKRVYTSCEIDYCRSKKKGKYESFTARFAAKEAVAKSIRTGFGRNISFNEIEMDKMDSYMERQIIILKNLKSKRLKYRYQQLRIMQ